ncbi:HRDC domain-containing protein [Conexibacter sp. SYSU D00693]|uniref:ribonuclease D n=1 Tax=Conexibacter sp. SYSU D00693 TaxID=2812560 RepID=UPI00196A8C49|nr:HRDC domain-containing protein [Conexibacter sp. SYSU D00693]
MASTSPAELAERARAAGRLGIDTEFMGEGRYQPLLCLVQIAIDDGDGGSDVFVLDPLTEEHDYAPLADVLGDPDVEVVLHAARQDVALLRRDWGSPVRNVFDTQVAAGFAGMRAQLGYEPLLKEVLGVRLRKSASFTRWDDRPLTEEQLQYAREDVVHLLQLASALQDRLDERGRLEWAREECRAFELIDDARDVDVLFAKLPRVNSLEPAQRAVARELVAWREQAAREADRPASTVLHEATLVEIAKRRPQSLDRLRQIRGVSEPTLHRRGKGLLAAVERGRSQPPIPVVGDRPSQPDPEDAPLIALSEALVRTKAASEGLAYELLASRADLQRIVTSQRTGEDEPEVRTLGGWRREVVGQELLELLAGRRSLRVGPRRRLEVEPVLEDRPVG